MYDISRAAYERLVTSKNRTVTWMGTITLSDGSTVDFDNSNIVERSGAISKQLCNTESIGIGNAYASELKIEFKGLDVYRYQLYDGVISLDVQFGFSLEISTWEDAAYYEYEEVENGGLTWGELSGHSYRQIEMGEFVIKEAMQSNGKIKVTAYDFMIRFNKDLPSQMSDSAKTPYAWIATACEACGVTLGTSRHDLYQMTNGQKTLKFSNANSEVKTWRDLLAECVAVLCANAIMGRNGELLVCQYDDNPVETILAGDRYSSNFSDYQVYYTGIYLSYREGNVKDYQTSAASAAEDTGLSYDLGYNSFMQITNDSERRAMMKAIIDRQSRFLFTPFDVSIPFNPFFDLQDPLLFGGNQADATSDVAPITTMIININGRMSLSCGGENPALQEVVSKESKAIESITSGDLQSNFWMTIDSAPDDSTPVTVSNTPVKVGEALFYANDDLSMFQATYTVVFNLAQAALVTIELFVDGVSAYKTYENRLAGKNTITIATGYQVSGKGSHNVSAYLSISAGA